MDIIKNTLIKVIIRIKRKVTSFFYKIERQEMIDKLKSCGENIRWPLNYHIGCPENITIGNNVKINDGVLLQGRGGIIIGNDTTLSVGVTILTAGYNLEQFKSGLRTHDAVPTYIGDNVWLCANVIVCPGVRITGKHVVVAAGSVLTHDISEDNCVWGGVPAKKIKNL